MKSQTGSLKGGGIKNMLIDHVEKIVLIGAGLFVLLALLMTNWVPYQEAPEELETKAQQALAQVESATWNDESRKPYLEAPDVRDDVVRMYQELNLDMFQYIPIGRAMFWPLYKQEEPIKEPKWLAVQDLIGDAGVVLISMQPPDALLAKNDGEAPDTNEAEQPKSDLPPDFRKNKTQRNAAGGGLGEFVPPEVGGPLGPGTPFDGEPMAGMDPSGVSGPVAYGEGYRFVSIRGVFPLRDQLKMLMNALHISDQNEAVQYLDLIDFELEKQQAIAGEANWTAWEKVDIDFAQEILEKSANFDAPVVDPAVTDPVFTMPLPMRLIGTWGKRASHPKVENYTISGEEREDLEKITTKVIEHYKEINKNRPPERVEKRGFYNKVYNFRDAQRQVFSGNDAKDNYNEILEILNRTKDDERAKRAAKKLLDHMVSDANAIGRLMLFRYIDFDVQPGNAYRYRVRIILRNPSWNRKVEDVIDPAVAEGQERFTPWSVPTMPIIVEDDVKYFLTQTEPGRGAALPKAKVDLFQWYADSGLPIYGKNLDTYIGQFIGGPKEIEVIRPAESKIEKEEVQFSTADMLIDVDEAPSLIRSSDFDVHRALGISRGEELGDMAFVVDQYGSLVALDPLSRADQHRKLQNRDSSIRTAYEDIKKQEEMLDDPAMMEDEMMMEAEMMDTGRRRGRGRRNVLRK